MSSWRAKLSTAYTRAGFGEAAYQQRLAQQQTQKQGPGRWVRGPRVPLTAAQHILHLLLTVFTAGLWAVVWIIRAVQGNQPWIWEPAPPWPPPPPQAPPARPQHPGSA
jgi:hypothetical protein